MSESKRYTPEESDSGAWRVMDEDASDGMEICLCTGDTDPGTDEMRRNPREDAERIARLLNAEEAVRAALRDVLAATGGEPKTCGHDFECACVGLKVRAALSALGEE